VTVRNVITSMRAISAVDWADLFESVSLVDEALRDGTDFAQLDFPTRDRYRRAIEELARGSQHTEIEIARSAVREAHRASTLASAIPLSLIAGGRRAFEAALGYRAAMSAWPLESARGRDSRLYRCVAIVAVVMMSWPLLTLAGAGSGAWTLALLAILGLVPAIDAAMAW